MKNKKKKFQIINYKYSLTTRYDEMRGPYTTYVDTPEQGFQEYAACIMDYISSKYLRDQALYYHPELADIFKEIIETNQ